MKKCSLLPKTIGNREHYLFYFYFAVLFLYKRFFLEIIIADKEPAAPTISRGIGCVSPVLGTELSGEGVIAG